MPAEYQVIVMRDSIAKDRKLIQEQAYLTWSQNNSEVFL